MRRPTNSSPPSPNSARRGGSGSGSPSCPVPPPATRAAPARRHLRPDADQVRPLGEPAAHHGRRLRRRHRRRGCGDGAAVRRRLGVPEALGRRLARNISSLLISEAHVAEVADPAGRLVRGGDADREIADAAWAEFAAHRARPAGSRRRSMTARCSARWASTAARTASRRIAHRRLPITGVSEFPHLRRGAAGSARRRPGRARRPRWATQFEALRDHPAARPVFLATLGTLAEHTARAVVRREPVHRRRGRHRRPPAPPAAPRRRRRLPADPRTGRLPGRNRRRLRRSRVRR